MELIHMIYELLLAHIINTLVGVHLKAALDSAVTTWEDIIVPKGRPHGIEKVTDLLLIIRLSIDQWNNII